MNMIIITFATPVSDLLVTSSKHNVLKKLNKINIKLSYCDNLSKIFIIKITTACGIHNTTLKY